MIKFIKSLFKNEELYISVNDKTAAKKGYIYDEPNKEPVTYRPVSEGVDVSGSLIQIDCGSLIQIDCDGALLVQGIESWIMDLVPMDSDSLDYSNRIIGLDTFLRLKDVKTGAVFLILRES